MADGGPGEREAAEDRSLESRIPDPSTLPRKQQQLAEMLLSRPEVFAFGNLNTIERLLGVSSITIIRFAKRLGFNGFQGLQSAVRSSYLSRAGFGLRHEAREQPVKAGLLVKETMDSQRQNLETVLSTMHLEDLQRAARTLASANRILAFGSGSAGIVALLLVRLLRHVGLHAELINQDGVDGVISLHDVTPEDVVIASSLWLNFSETSRTLRLAKRLGAQTIAIVGGHASPLAALADQSLYAPGQGVALSFSLTAPVALIECLVAAIASERTERVEAIQRHLHELYVEEDLIAPTGIASEAGSRRNKG